MERPSDRQIELLERIYKKCATKADIREYLSLVVTDNVIGMEKLPKVVFKPRDKVGNFYAMMTEKSLIFSSMVVDDIRQNPELFAEALDITGHELKHFNQRHVNLDEILDKKAREYHANVKHEMQNYQEAYGEDLHNLRVLEKPRSIKILDELFKQYPEEDVAQFYLNSTYLEKKYLRENVEESRYLANLHETDARYAGVLYQELMLDIYLSDKRIQANEQLYSWIAEIKKKSLETSVRDYNELMEDVVYYNKFDQSLQSVSKEFLVELAQRIVNAQAVDEKETLEALLSICAKQHVKSVEKKSLRDLFRWAIQNMNEQETNGDPKPERILACKFVKWIYFDDRNSTQEKTELAKELFNVVLEHANVDKNFMQKEKHIHKFDNLDTFLLHVFAWEKFDWNEKIVEALAKNKRFEELCDFVDIKKLYLAEVDMAGTLPKTYLKHILSLLSGKGDIFSSVCSDYVNQRFAHNVEAQRLKWYLSAIEKTKGELIYVYCKQEGKRPPKTEKQVKNFYKYIFAKTEFDVKELDNAQIEAENAIKAHPARFKEKE